MNPWDQQADESAAAYRRFLVYRDLGPARSLSAAYQLAQPGRKKATKGNKKQRVSGQWTSDCARYDWVARARAWDVAQLADRGQNAVVGFVAALEAYTLKVVEGLQSAARPRSWQQLTDALHVLSQLIPAETIQALHADAGARRLPERNGAGTRSGRLPD